MPSPRASSCPPRLWHRQPHELPLRGLPYNSWTLGAPPGVQPVSRLGSPQPKDKGEGKDAKDQGLPVADASEDKGKETFSSAARASEDQGSPVADASKLFRLLQRE